MKNQIVKRYDKNPILTKDDVPYTVYTVQNAGVVKYNDKYIMLFRSHLQNGRSRIGIHQRALLRVHILGEWNTTVVSPRDPVLLGVRPCL